LQKKVQQISSTIASSSKRLANGLLQGTGKKTLVNVDLHHQSLIINQQYNKAE